MITDNVHLLTSALMLRTANADDENDFSVDNSPANQLLIKAMELLNDAQEYSYLLISTSMV